MPAAAMTRHCARCGGPLGPGGECRCAGAALFEADSKATRQMPAVAREDIPPEAFRSTPPPPAPQDDKPTMQLATVDREALLRDAIPSDPPPPIAPPAPTAAPAPTALPAPSGLPAPTALPERRRTGPDSEPTVEVDLTWPDEAPTTRQRQIATPRVGSARVPPVDDDAVELPPSGWARSALLVTLVTLAALLTAFLVHALR